MRVSLIIVVLAILAIIVWLSFHTTLKKEPQPQTQTIVPSQTSSVQPPQPFVSTTNAPSYISNNLVRPASLDEQTWNKFLSYREVVLSENQPIEFYARALDQSGKPVEGVKLHVSIERLDESVFVATNYLHWDPALAFQKLYFDLYSDANGWIQFTGTNGIVLDMTGLSKEGYISAYPNGNFGGVHYEPSGTRVPSGDILMTNAWNPQKGYILHLQKIEGTNSTNLGK